MPRFTHLLPTHARAWSTPLTAIAVGIIGALFIVLDVSALAEPAVQLQHRRLVQGALLLVGCTVMLGKRRAPVSALAAGVALFALDLALGGGIGMLLVLIDLLYSAALHTSDRGRRALLVIIGIVLVGGVASVLALSGDLRATATAALSLFAVFGTPYWWGLAVQRERASAALEARRADDLEELAALTRQQIVQEERGRMARDLHDAIASELSAIAIHTEVALAAPAAPRASLETIRAASIRSLEQMRSMILVLRSGGEATTAPDRLTDADGILDRARARGLVVSIEGRVPTLPVAIDQAAGRILQESLTNAMKHAQGAATVVRVERMRDAAGADALSLRIESALGAGALSAPPSAGLGVPMMRERALALGGALTAGPEHGGDAAAAHAQRGGEQWIVRATLPLT